MDDAAKRAALQRIAEILGIPVDEIHTIRRDAGPGDDELNRAVRAFSRMTDVRLRRFYLEGLETGADRDES